MEQPKAASFKKSAPAPLRMGDVIRIARDEMSAINDLPVDSVIRCERAGDDGWTVVLEVIESPARMGENDFLASFSLSIDATGNLSAIDRLDRYRREDGGGR